MNRKPCPPRWPDKLLTWLIAPHLHEEVLGDLHERFHRRAERLGGIKARRRYWREVLAYVRLSFIKRKPSAYSKPTNTDMISNYFKIAFRNLVKNPAYSFINIFGLATAMAVAMLIGLWMYDELSFDKQPKHYDRIAQLWQFVKFDAEKSSYAVLPIPLANELRSKYPDFESVSLAVSREAVLDATGNQKFTKIGKYVEPGFTKMMSLTMRTGTDAGLNDVNSILLSESTAAAFFGSANPVNQLVKLNNKRNLRVSGVYEDFPSNSTFSDVSFLAPWKLFVAIDAGAKDSQNKWDNNDYQIFAQLKPGADFEEVSAKIKDIRMKMDNPPGYKPEFFLHPMRKWHLYSDFKDGVNTGGLIVFVWLFGIIGSFVLLLACINFMNLSTARSEKRAREVGIRKAVGSVRSQLVVQFFSESLVLSLLALVVSLLFVGLTLPFFNQMADKQMTLLWSNPGFWLSALGFSLLTGLIAGSYPALYLSSFQPVKVLKGAFRVGRFAAVPRKVLVGFQFTVSVTLIIGTIIVFRQIQHAKDRPVGYNRSGLIEIRMNTPDLYGHYESLRSDLLGTGAVAEMAESDASITVQNGGMTNVSWRGQAADLRPLMMSNRITHDYGKTVGWQVVAGRDFSRKFSTDSAAVILNETAVKLMGFKNPIGEIITWGGAKYTVTGMVRDMVRESPFEPVKPSFFVLNYEAANTIHAKLAPQLPAREALAKVEQVFRTYSPASPFDYKFVDDGYARKFGHEERIGKLAGVFSGLAILISCLGLFGLASFMAEQRTKEIGIRKVLGASVFTVWRLLSKEFVVLVIIAFCLAAPLAYYVLSDWLQNYEYRTELSWWIFAASGIGALVVTLLTVSFQSIKAALVNPVKSLRSE
ncbi:ABC transporter permease [Larkinella humicola]|uniref:FtsX-like permease family protein n=1 Tax=Larkinella humicola TaxID=2607654 RepID=A0A5N1J6P3_9BACT|nr:ABC transporter permease [Larkinella humicola]KAA9346672.1 FtsX-like permease family protein [Larkinella humicola]